MEGSPAGGDPKPLPNKANVRTVAKGSTPTIAGRKSPTTKSDKVQSLKRGVDATFDGFIRGEKIAGNSIWYRGAINGNYFWSGNFTTKSGKGLKDLGKWTAPKPAAKKEYVRLSSTWYYYTKLSNALVGNYSPTQRVSKGDYLVIKKDSRGPVQIKTSKGNVWVGTRNTKPFVIKK